MRRIISLLRPSRGQSLTELALILPFLLVLIGGVVDFGLFMFIGQVIQNGAREGVRMAATRPTPGPTAGSGTIPGCRTSTDVIIKTACTRLPDVGLFNGFTVTSTAVTGTAPNQQVQVRVSGTYRWFLLKLIPHPLPLLGGSGFSSAPVPIARSATMRWEWQ